MKVSAKGSLNIEKDRVTGESKLLQAIDSENIINAVEIILWDKRLYIFLEYMEGGSMTSIIEKCFDKYSEEFIKYTLYRVALGLADLHKMQVLHRDIKSDNILCRADGVIKVADLGLAVFLVEQ